VEIGTACVSRFRVLKVSRESLLSNIGHKNVSIVVTPFKLALTPYRAVMLVERF